MRKTEKVISCLFLFLTVICLALGCKRPENQDLTVSLGWERDYSHVEKNIEAVDGDSIWDFRSIGNYVSYVTLSEEFDSIFLLNTQNGTCKGTLKFDRDECELLAYNLSNNGTLLALVYRYIDLPADVSEDEESGTLLSEGENFPDVNSDYENYQGNYFVVKKTEYEDLHYYEINEPEFVKELDECSDYYVAMCGSERVVIGTEFKVSVCDLNEAGVSRKLYSKEEIYGIQSYDNDSVLLKRGGDKYGIYDCKKGRETGTFSQIDWFSTPYVAEDGILFAYDKTKLYFFSDSDRKNSVLYWSDYGVDGSLIDKIYLDNGTLHCIMREGLSDWKDLYLSDDNNLEKESTDITYLTIGCVRDDSAFENAIAAFNRSSKDIKVIIKDYSESEAGSPENALYNDILAGTGPDLVQINREEMGDDRFIRANMLEGLSPYLEGSTVVKRSDFIPTFLDAISYDGEIYYCPTNFFFDCRYGIYDDNASWNLDRFLEYIKSNQNREIAMSRSEYIDLIAVNALCKDIEPEEIRADVKIIVETLSFLTEPGIYNPDFSARKKGKIILEGASFMDAQDYLVSRSIWGGGTIKGYPEVEGSGCYFVPDNSYAISSTSSNKMAAWRFIEYFFTEEGRENGTPNWLFSSNKELFEEQLRAMTLNDNNKDELVYSYIDEDLYVEVMPAPEEIIDELRNAVYNTKSIVRSSKEVHDIIAEESEYYFRGEKNKEEAIDVIMGRLKAYYGERE